MVLRRFSFVFRLPCRSPRAATPSSGCYCVMSQKLPDIAISDSTPHEA